ncbi:Fic family protein [Magnetovibrio blakemorei]|uniref:Cell filamentation protein Fic n=1 Tax=Magnetovibrio blakemorei TaxID=28181 RepID=A0A1E5Q4H0_9PROT|nr:Fic family protein [Magnetovibrio blakemorei]OEJ64784.1 cell filamentation protein Fic [Magnetovibrio blakemorei]
MTWNWRDKDWPHFRWDAAALEKLEQSFLHQAGVVSGCLKHMSEDENSSLTVELISTEAVKTSEIEGDILDRDSVQSSVRRNFGLDTDARRIAPAERGIADMMVDLYRSFDRALDHKQLYTWHKMLTSGRRDLHDIGRYRTHEEAMQVVSGYAHNPKVHFEAPPSQSMTAEMSRFIDWYNATAPKGPQSLTPLARAGVAHLYFVSIHPFEDGNGRVGRALSEKALSQGLGHPTLLAMSQTIQAGRKTYYQMLEQNNRSLDITAWLIYFAETVLDAQKATQELIDFLIAKTRLYDRLRGHLNDRQTKVLERMFREGPDGFKGGMSAEKYIALTGTSRATATRDLADLVQNDALTRTGERKHTRYWLNIKSAL